MTLVTNRNYLVAVATFSVLLLLAWFLYAPALTGTFLLDDHGNLDGLQHIDGWRAALRFVASGDAGPLGRPLALASFLPQAAYMEVGPRAFLVFNMLLHLFNAALLAVFLYRMSDIVVRDQRNALFVAVVAAAIWLFMPLLASSSLMVVQRMTTLSATVIFLSLIAYLQARSTLDRNSDRALVRMGIALLVGTILAALVKEIGALLPTLVLAMEVTVLRRPDSVSIVRWRAFAATCLVLPTLLICAYLATRIPYSDELVLKRDFGGWERLMTQSRILWEYLFNAFVPQPDQFGPFQDGHAVARTILNPVTFLSFAAWIAVFSLAILWRRRYPVFAFAVLWYLGGHLLESTFLHLELYFEHRNYVPIVGPIFALCVIAVQAPIAKKKLVYVGLPLYALVNAAALVGVTSLWGQPAVAAHFWHERHPDSVRAATHLASYQMAINGPDGAIKIIKEFTERHPNDGYLRIQELKLKCVFSPGLDHSQLANELMLSLNDIHFDYISATALSHLATTLTETDCQGVDLDTVKSIARGLLKNPRYQPDPLYNQIHHQIMAQIAQQQGNNTEAIRHLKLANDYVPDAYVNAIMVSVYTADGKYSEAREFIESARSRAPIHPLKRYEWLSVLDDLSQHVRELERHSATQETRQRLKSASIDQRKKHDLRTPYPT